MLPIEKAGRPASIVTNLSVGAMVLTIVLPLIPFTARLFEFVTPTLAHLGIIILLAAVYFVVSEIAKRPLSRYLDRMNS